MSKSINVIPKIGMYSALTTGICTALFALFIVLGFVTETIYYQFLVCFVLAVSYVVLANALYSSAEEHLKVWGRIAVSFAVMYAVFICLVYYSQLTVVRLGQMPESILDPIRYEPGSWLFALDMLGYAFLTLSTVAALFLFKNQGLGKAIRVFLIIHGALALPTLIFPALPLFGTADSVQGANLGGALALLAWCVIFAPACFLIARHFSLLKKDSVQA